MAAAATLALSAPLAQAAQEPPLVVVEKSPSCGCCTGWVEHMRAEGFEVEARDVSPDQLDRTKAALGITPDTMSCHTAMVGAYVIEGHVPAADVRRLLDAAPEALGLAAPGMPAASPGMDVGTEPYDVLLIDEDGATSVFATH
jgi:hypothetical protein